MTMADWNDVFGAAQEVASEMGADQQDREDLLEELSEWWEREGKDAAKDWTKRQVKKWLRRRIQA